MAKNFLKNFFVYAAFFVLLFILRKSSFPISLPFGLYVGFLYCLNPYISTLVFCLSALPFELSTIFITLAQGAVMVLVALIYSTLCKKINKGLLVLYVLLAQVFYILYGLAGADELFDRLVNAGICVVFSFVSVYVVRAVFVRGLKYRLGVDEKICAAVMIVALTTVLSQIYIVNLQLIRVFVPFLMLGALFVYGGGAAFCTAAVFGLGSAIATGTLADIAVFCLWALAATAFSSLSRWLSTFGILLAEIITMYFFEAYGTFDALTLIPCVIGCAAFCLVPTKILDKLTDMLGGAKEQYSARYIINRLRTNLAKKFFELSDIFYQMELTFKSMVKGVLTPENAVLAISREVSDNVCRDCNLRAVCWRTNMVQTEQDFCEVTSAAMDRGKATLLDLPSAMASKCNRLNSILSSINSEVAAYKQYYMTSTSSDNSKLLIGEQLSGVSQILMQLSQQCKGVLTFDREKEKLMLEELTFCNVLTKEVVIWEEQGQLFVTLTVSAADANKEILLQIVSRISNCNMMVDAVERIPDNANWIILHLKQKPVYNITFGLASAIKEGSEVSGDTHSFIKINKDKFLIALCDGMGSGVGAEKTSNVAISLVENFYKAGFDNDIILSSVNKLLATANEENFTAVDICVINLNRGLADFIKLASPTSVVRCNGEVQFISGGNLPLGVLEEMKPSSTKKALQAGDMIVLYTDGFYDCFEDKNEIGELLEQNVLTNPQVIAEQFLEKAKEKCSNSPKDDMTVIVARVTNS